MSVEVRNVLPNGNFILQLQIDRIQRESSSKEKTLVMSAARDLEGRPQVDVRVSGNNPIFQRQDFKSILRQIARNMLDLRIELELTPRGGVTSVQLEGDPFQNLPSDSQIARMIGKIVRKLVSKEDLAQIITAEAFAQLPAGPVRVNQSWPVARNFSVMGLQMNGTGRSTLQAIPGSNGTKTAAIRETMTYTVNTAKYGAMLKDFTESLMADAGLEVDVEANFRVEENPTFTSASIFNVDDGVNMSTTWEDQKIRFGGTMAISAYGETSRIRMDVTVTVDSKVKWTQL
jgi:hypothetical protein